MKRKAKPQLEAVTAVMQRVAKAQRPTKAQLDRLNAAMEPLREIFAEYGRIGGKMGAHARWDHVSKRERVEGARKAALARWKGKRKAT